LASRGVTRGLDETMREIAERDAQDSGRAVAPLRPAEDAVRLDTSEMDLDAVVDELVRIVRTRG
jgi:cytidylate kinase